MQTDTLTKSERYARLAALEKACAHDKRIDIIRHIDAFSVNGRMMDGWSKQCADCHGTGLAPLFPGLREACPRLRLTGSTIHLHGIDRETGRCIYPDCDGTGTECQYVGCCKGTNYTVIESMNTLLVGLGDIGVMSILFDFMGLGDIGVMSILFDFIPPKRVSMLVRGQPLWYSADDPDFESALLDASLAVMEQAHAPQ